MRPLVYRELGVAPHLVPDADELRRRYPGAPIVDDRESQIAEYCRAYPTQGVPTPAEFDLWYFPWVGIGVYFMQPHFGERLLCARNLVLFTQAQMHRIRSSSVGIAGMSVGSRVLEPLAHGPGLALIRLADMDVVTATGLGRQPFGTQDLGLPKVTAAARLVTSVRPWAHVELFSEGLTPDNLEQFLDGLDVVVDAMDNPYMKLLLRQVARRLGVDVIMGTDVEQGLIDFEPHQTETNYPLFGGRLAPETFATLLAHPEPGPHTMLAIAEIVGPEYLTVEGLELLLELVQGRLPSISQLATTSTIVGGAVARMIHLRLAGMPVRPGRIVLRLDEQLLVEDPEREAYRKELLAQVQQLLQGAAAAAAGMA